MILIDTNVVSELMRSAPEPAVVRWMNHQPSSLLYLAAVSIAEIKHGISKGVDQSGQEASFAFPYPP